jgi:hypothetical protein
MPQLNGLEGFNEAGGVKISSQYDLPACSGTFTGIHGTNMINLNRPGEIRYVPVPFPEVVVASSFVGILRKIATYTPFIN